MLELVTHQEKRSYRAFEPVRGDSRPMFELRQHNDSGYLLPYAYLRTLSYSLSDPKEHTLSLFHLTGTVTICGRNLGELKEKFSTHAVSWVQVFDSQTDAPPEENQPIITRLDFEPKEPEPGDD